jgi:phenylacetate-CoA ligase
MGSLERVANGGRRMFLERWIYDQIGEGSDIKAFKLSRLRSVLDYVSKESPFYRHLFNANAIKPSGIRSSDDLAIVPFTTPDDLREKAYRFPCVSLSRVKRVFSLYTAGTSAAPKIVFFSQEDLDRITDYMGAAMKSVAESGRVSTQGFKVYILLPDGKPESQQKMLAKGVEKIGAVPILGNLAMTTEEQLERIEQSRPDVLFGPVSRVYRITQEGKDSHDLHELGIKILFITSEYVPLSMRRRLEDVWKGEVFTHYGMTEMGWAGGIESESHDGFYFNEADFLLEIVDPDTGVPLRNGEEGELVLTTLNRDTMPLIRYKTGDLGRLIEASRKPGAPRLQRLDSLIKRRHSLVRMSNGDAVYPGMLDDALYEIPNIISYQALLSGEKGKEQLILRVAVTQKWTEVEEDVTSALLGIPSIKNNVEAGLMNTPRVEVVDQAALRRPGRVKRLIADERPAGSS